MFLPVKLCNKPRKKKQLLRKSCLYRRPKVVKDRNPLHSVVYTYTTNLASEFLLPYHGCWIHNIEHGKKIKSTWLNDLQLTNFQPTFLLAKISAFPKAACRCNSSVLGMLLKNRCFQKANEKVQRMSALKSLSYYMFTRNNRVIV